MEYIYLLAAGVPVSAAHFYLVSHHRDNRRYSISEHAVLSRNSSLLYLVAHVNCEVFYVLFSYQLFIANHSGGIDLAKHRKVAMYGKLKKRLGSAYQTLVW